MKRRSRWLIIVVFAAVALVCARLGIWQLHRLQERRALNRAALAERTRAPLDLELDDTLASVSVNRRVRVTGRYDDSRDIVLRGRAYQGVPGVEIVSPLVNRSGTSAILVNRGFVPTPDANTVPTEAYRAPGETHVTGIALSMSSGGGVPIRHGSGTTWAKLDRNLLSRRFPYHINSIYIQQTPDSVLPSGSSAPARFPRPLEPPPLDDGPHLSYAIQWFAFSLMAVVFGILIARQSSDRPTLRLS
ncbi:MAG TPA: SURF1 family protein [Gemmatimonadales bacterium]|nr:SURF1 family protein [Gemmatimonadales bacterium]